MNHESRLPVKAGATATNRSRLNAALAKSQNQMLTANITNRSQANALMAEVRNSAQAAGVNLANKNVNAALTRIMQYQSSLNP
jgi:ketopantoate reductase